ncbi:MAG TPA: hypothetical protein VGN74_05275 [Brevundimonas sp.]|uniref:hypothetical protein n=1 Tax=Brevundimonas sp. TaxID=1871086 RepID=UPI002E135141|nr:hypothetical protein [Brevundimonas sp.]
MRSTACARALAGLAAAASVGLAEPASASPDLEPAFGNTVVSEYPDGGWVRHWFEPDGRYRALFSSGREISGRWRVEGDRICLNDITPSIMMIRRFCTPMIEGEVGARWTSRDPLGRRVTNQLVRGR